MTPETVLSASKLYKEYGKGESLFVALDDINLSIERGESIAIIGKSGSGKSTLMHLLALMDVPTRGALYIDGQDVSTIKPSKLNSLRNKTFGFVFQQFFLTANSSVLDNVILPLKIAGVSTSERRKRGLEALKMVGIEEKSKNKANDLSGGQKQRVVIARALINNPRVIFADEPTGNLDSTTGGVIEDLLFNLNKKQGITLIVVTHDPELAARCDRQIHIKDGRLTIGKTIK